LGTTFLPHSEGKTCFGYHFLGAFRRQNVFWVPLFYPIPKAKRVLGTKPKLTIYFLKFYKSNKYKISKRTWVIKQAKFFEKYFFMLKNEEADRICGRCKYNEFLGIKQGLPGVVYNRRGTAGGCPKPCKTATPPWRFRTSRLISDRFRKGGHKGRPYGFSFFLMLSRL
jgi:hypothetical protein